MAGKGPVQSMKKTIMTMLCATLALCLLEAVLAPVTDAATARAAAWLAVALGKRILRSFPDKRYAA